jgi:hypothetical protein
MEHGMTPRNGDVVAALIDNESTLKTFLTERGKAFLHAENPKYPKMIPASELVIQGVMVALIRKRDELDREFAKHFRIGPDHARFWHSFSDALLYMPTACTFRFHCWAEFEQRMPRYAGRIRRVIQSWQRGTREDTYKIEYAS